jgi:hypothetical protein
VDHLASHCQAQAHTVGLGRDERLEKAVGHFRRWARTAIQHVDHGPLLIALAQADVDLAAGAAGFDGISQHIEEKLTQLPAVAANVRR